MKNRIIHFDTRNENTCSNDWTFDVTETQDGKMINSVKIQADAGCAGHPKTIMALVRDVPAASLDLEALSQTNCPRSKSCGMVLGECVQAIING